MKSKFILNCPDDFLTKTRGQILKRALIWLVLLMAAAVFIRMACIAVYMLTGTNPQDLTNFGGEAKNWIGQGIGKSLLTLMVIAPVLEEALFRLPLSFNRKTVALWAGLLPVIIAYYFFNCKTWYILLALAAAGALLYLLVCKATNDGQWANWREKAIVPAMWVSAISFGLIHLVAFSVLSLPALPYILATILIPLAGGCAVTYARVNAGFWWGVILHLLINFPTVLMIVFTSLQS